MSKSNKIKSINKRLESIFKDIKGLPFNDTDKILFNIELLKNKYLHRIKHEKTSLYEETANLRAVLNDLKGQGVIGNIER